MSRKGDMIQRIGQQLSDDDIEKMIQSGVEEKVVPALKQIRERREDQPDAEDIREEYRNLSSEEQGEIFWRTVDDIIGIAWTLRSNPQHSVQKIKSAIRDPWTLEGLLLIFENEEHIDAEYSKELKETATLAVQQIGVAIAPEMYDEETVERVAEQLGLDVEQYDKR